MEDLKDLQMEVTKVKSEGGGEKEQRVTHPDSTPREGEEVKEKNLGGKFVLGEEKVEHKTVCELLVHAMVLEVAEPVKGYLKKTHEGLKFQKTVVVGGGNEVIGGVQCEFSLQISLQHGVTRIAFFNVCTHGPCPRCRLLVMNSSGGDMCA